MILVCFVLQMKLLYGNDGKIQGCHVRENLACAVTHALLVTLFMSVQAN